MFKGRMLRAGQGWAAPEGQRWGFLRRQPLPCPQAAQLWAWGRNNPGGQWGKSVLALSFLWFFSFWWQQSCMKEREQGWLWC